MRHRENTTKTESTTPVEEPTVAADAPETTTPEAQRSAEKADFVARLKAALAA